MVEVAHGDDGGHVGIVDFDAVLLLQRDHDIEHVGRLRAKILHQALIAGHVAAAQYQANGAAHLLEIGSHTAPSRRVCISCAICRAPASSMSLSR